MRTHSLMDLEAEREPSLEQLLNERDPRFYSPLSEWLGHNVAKLVRERDASK